jgi:aminoglycoside phosphotransferase (APT) family kinase protein
VEAELQRTWPGATLDRPPTPVLGGEWARMDRLAVSGTPAGVPGDLVLRVVPHPEMGAKELAVQRAAAEAGVATPAVRLSGPEGGPLGGAWAVMDFADGRPLLAGLDGAAAVLRFPAIFRSLPRQLAQTMAMIHRVDPGPIEQAVRAAAPDVALTIDELWPHLRSAADAIGDTRLQEALDALIGRRPDDGARVLCHGDLHPFNILAAGEQITVLDWTAAVIGPPAFDVALTWLLLRHPPMHAPAGLKPVIGAAGRGLAGRFVARYRAANPDADLTDLDWYAAMHSARVLIDLAAWRLAGDPQAETHPWRLVAPGAAAVLEAAGEARR